MNETDRITLTPEARARIDEAQKEAEIWLSKALLDAHADESGNALEQELMTFCERLWLPVAREMLRVTDLLTALPRLEQCFTNYLEWVFENRHPMRYRVDRDGYKGRFVSVGWEFLRMGRAWREIHGDSPITDAHAARVEKALEWARAAGVKQDDIGKTLGVGRSAWYAYKRGDWADSACPTKDAIAMQTKQSIDSKIDGLT